MDARGSAAFPTTRWTVLLDLKGAKPKREQALTDLCQTYWYPLYAFVRQRGRSPEDAEDLTQAFFAQLLSGNGFDRAEQDRGKLRSYLLGAMTRFLTSRYRYDTAKKRGGTAKRVTMDPAFAEQLIDEDSWDGASPEKIFDQRWAHTVISAVRDDLAREYAARGRDDHFAALSDYLFWNSGESPYAEISEQLGISKSAVSQTLRRMRKRFTELLRDRVSTTVEDESLVDEEIRELLGAFSQSS